MEHVLITAVVGCGGVGASVLVGIGMAFRRRRLRSENDATERFAVDLAEESLGSRDLACRKNGSRGSLKFFGLRQK